MRKRAVNDNGLIFSVAKTEQNGGLVWRKQNTQKEPSRLEPQGIAPFLVLVGVFFLEN
jgi:hypothetical protein